MLRLRRFAFWWAWVLDFFRSLVAGVLYWDFGVKGEFCDDKDCDL